MLSLNKLSTRWQILSLDLASSSDEIKEESTASEDPGKERTPSPPLKANGLRIKVGNRRNSEPPPPTEADVLVNFDPKPLPHDLLTGPGPASCGRSEFEMELSLGKQLSSGTEGNAEQVLFVIKTHLQQSWSRGADGNDFAFTANNFPTSSSYFSSFTTTRQAVGSQIKRRTSLELACTKEPSSITRRGKWLAWTISTTTFAALMASMITPATSWDIAGIRFLPGLRIS